MGFGEHFEVGQYVVWHTQQPDMLVRVVNEQDPDTQGFARYGVRCLASGGLYAVSESELRPLGPGESVAGWQGK